MDRETELALVGRLRAGDHSAFDVVFNEFHKRLFNFLARLTRRRDLAEDLLEETWVRLVEHASRLQGDTRLGPWLFSVARNLYVSYARSRSLDRTHTGELVGVWPVTAPRSPFETVAANEASRRLEAALATLPAHYREVLLLVGIEGFTTSEAAVVCRISDAAVRQRLCRGKAMLTRALEKRPSSRRSR